MSSDRETDHNLLPEDSEDEFDWEEVEVPEHEPQHLEITINAKPKANSSTNKSVTEFHERRTEFLLFSEKRLYRMQSV